MKKFWLILFVCVLSACSSDKEEVKAGRYGMMSDGTPQYTAVLFMRAIYNENTLDKALSMSTDRFARILKRYHTNKNVQRQIFNLRLDTMETEPVSGGSLIFAERQKEAKIDMKIIGHYNGKKIIELKTLSMIKESGEWKVFAVTNTVP